jgi:uncharacterized membrane protein YphA (DoxX/SURF4 family)
MTKFKKYGLWAVMILTAVGFLAGGAGKLMGVPMMHKSFELLGLPVAMGYFIGVCEIAGAIGIFIKRLSSLAAAGLAIIMVGAMYFHLNFEPQGFPFAAALFIFSIIIFFAHKKDSILFANKQSDQFS